MIMESFWAQVLIYPIIAGVVLLCIEYLFFLPWYRSRELSLPTSSNANVGNNQRKWSDGIRSSVKYFKQNFNNYKWDGISIRHHLVEVSDFSVDRGQAEVYTIVKVRYLLDKPRPVAKYKLIIDRIGDILDIITVFEDVDPFEDRDLKLPESWFIIGAIILAIIFCRDLETVGSLQRKGIVNNTPVENLWSQATPISVNSSMNGTVGSNGVDAYLFTSESIHTVTISIEAVGEFSSQLLIYDQKKLLIQSEFFSSQPRSIPFAPALNESYLILIASSRGEGGSYRLHLSDLDATAP